MKAYPAWSMHRCIIPTNMSNMCNIFWVPNLHLMFLCNYKKTKKKTIEMRQPITLQLRNSLKNITKYLGNIRNPFKEPFIFAMRVISLQTNKPCRTRKIWSLMTTKKYKIPLWIEIIPVDGLISFFFTIRSIAYGAQFYWNCFHFHYL